MVVGIAAVAWATTAPLSLDGSPGLLPSDECGEGAAPCPSPDAAAAGAEKLPPAGAKAPGFELSDPEGNPVVFRAGQGGEPALLIFWSLFCPPCREEMPLFADLAVRYPPPALRVIAVNLDGDTLARAVTQYSRLQGLPFPVAMDQKQNGRFAAAGAYGISGTPALVLIGADGKVVWSHEGRVDPLELESAITEGLR
jgi:thiol-disulfide isomerase/thioredoxin